MDCRSFTLCYLAGVNPPISPWSPYEGRTDVVSKGRRTLTSALADLVSFRTGFSSIELPHIFAAPVDEGENDAARDLVRLDAEHLASVLAVGKLDSFVRPLGGGEVASLPAYRWELDDPLPRFATGALNLDRWWDASAELTHRIFVDARQFDHWLASLKPFGPLTDRQIEAIVDPQLRAARAVAAEAAKTNFARQVSSDKQGQPPNDPPGVGPKLLTLKEVTELTTRSSSTIYNMVKEGTFPEWIKLGSSSRWRESEVLDWIEEQAAKRPNR